jgi:arylsulfatase A-like enzyme
MLFASGCAWITRASVSGETEGNLASDESSLDGTGRVLAFASAASTLVPGDTNGVADVFARETLTRTIERVSVGVGGAQANGASRAPSVSSDGRYIAFISDASNLVAGDTNGVADLFRFDRTAHQTLKISEATGAPSISADGTKVAFERGGAVFVSDVATAQTVLVSNAASAPDLSPDGRLLAFQSAGDVFVQELSTAIVTQIDVTVAGVPSVAVASDPAVDNSGAVTFTSDATDLVPGGLGLSGATNVYLRRGGTTTLVTPAANGNSRNSRLSDDGRYIAFESDATNVVGGDTNGKTDVFVRDVQTSTTQRASTAALLDQANGASTDVDISGNGQYVSFTSDATNLDPNDHNGVPDVFIRFAFPPTVESMSPATIAPGAANQPFTVNGRGFRAGVAVLATSATFTVTSVTETQITGTVTIDTLAAPGMRDVTVGLPGLGGAQRGGADSCACLTVVDPSKMNVVFVLTDDGAPGQYDEVADLKPNGFFAWMRANGRRYDMTSNNNICCPGRAVLWTGQTSQNAGVVNITDFRRIGSSLATDLQGAGWCTGLSGKLFAEYKHKSSDQVEPGWTYFEPAWSDYPLFTPPGTNPPFHALTRAGTTVDPTDYSTDYIGTTSSAQLTDCWAQHKPAYIVMNPFAPHAGVFPEATYASTPVAPWTPTDPSFNEADFSDKPQWMQSHPGFQLRDTAALTAEMQDEHTRIIRSLLSVDDAGAALRDQVIAAGALDHTIFVVMPDNGLLLGEHRVEIQKFFPWPQDNLEAFIVGPGFAPGTTSPARVSNMDVAPTLSAAVGVPPSGRVPDGLPIQTVEARADRGNSRWFPVKISPYLYPFCGGSTGVPCGKSADGALTSRYLYWEYNNGEKEMYDLTTDPAALTNIASSTNPTYVAARAQLSALTVTGRTCAGATCQTDAPAALRRS